MNKIRMCTGRIHIPNELVFGFHASQALLVSVKSFCLFLSLFLIFAQLFELYIFDDNNEQKSLEELKIYYCKTTEFFFLLLAP